MKSLKLLAIFGLFASLGFVTLVLGLASLKTKPAYANHCGRFDPTCSHGGCSDLDPTCNPNVRPITRPLTEETWGEAGRGLYISGANFMERDNVTRPFSPLNESQKTLLRREFGSLVDRVRIKYGADMLDRWGSGDFQISQGSDGQTFCNTIYIKDIYRNGDYGQLRLLAHELKHSRQCEELGGMSNFGYHYFKEYKKVGLNYENNLLERQAREVEEKFSELSVKVQNRNWGRCLNLQSATQNGVGVNSWECVSHPDQEWKITDIGNGYVRIQNRNWGRCLNLQSATQNGVGVNSWECVSHPDQEWKITDIGNGYVRIQNRNWGRCLNLQSATQNGVGVNSWECVSHPDQEWRISPL